MSFQDKTIQCADCGTDFSFTAGEQEFFQSKGFTNEPRRCPVCRKARKTERNGSSGNSYGLPRETFAARRARYGKDAEVPFALTDARLAYYSTYFSKVRLSN
jgi:Probable zinc-ribbon domain